MSTALVGRRFGLARRRATAAPSGMNPFAIHQLFTGGLEVVPDPIEFIVSPEFLNRPNLYPRQATFIKVIFLRDDLFTTFDWDVLEEWESTFLSTGNEGIAPGIMDRIIVNSTCSCGHRSHDHRRKHQPGFGYDEEGNPEEDRHGDRIEHCNATDCECRRYDGRLWFRETQGVIGRRGSKGYMGGLCGAYVLWTYMHRPGGPQDYYGIDRDKRLTGIVFAGKKEQAQANQWKDLNNVITGGPCFSTYISRPQAERLTIFAPTDKVRIEQMEALGIRSEADIASFEIVPAPSTTMAARGPTSFMQFYDEQAHVLNSTANADAEAVYSSATPALDQFKKDGFIYAPSSPWAKTGQFFQNWELAIEMDPNGKPVYPERLMLQLPSWGPYEDWEEAYRIPLRPPVVREVEEVREVKRRRKIDGKRKMVLVKETTLVEQKVPDELGCFRPLRSAIQAYDEDMRQLERANPDTFKVERRSHWAESLDAYLNPDKVADIFKPWDGTPLFIQKAGILRETYSAHGDPATSNKRFGWSVGHRVWVPKVDGEGKETGEGMYHVVFDQIRCWEPADFPDHILDYEDGVMPDIWEDVKGFIPEDVSFDQFNVPATIGWLRKRLAKEQLPKAVRVHEVVRTRQVNWRHYELFKSAINMGLVHAPMYLPQQDEDGNWEVNYASSEVENELKFLEEKNGAVNHPTTGPVQTKDIADTMCEVVVQLIGKQMATLLGQELDAVGLSGAASMGTDPGRHTRTDTSDVANRLANVTGGARGMGRGLGPSRGMGRRR